LIAAGRSGDDCIADLASCRRIGSQCRSTSLANSGRRHLVAVFCLICAVVSAVLAIFTWMRYVAALCVAFLLWAGVTAPGVLSRGGGIAAHPVAVLLTAALALLLVAALATRRRANMVEFDRSCFD